MNTRKITTSSGILFLKDKKLFVGHETQFKHWDIPKSKNIINNNYQQACTTGCYKQLNFFVEENDLLPIGVYKYHNFKNIALFIYTGDNYPDPNKTICKETVVSIKDNKKNVPVFDDFKYIELDEIKKYCTSNFYNLMKEIVLKYYNLEI